MRGVLSRSCSTHVLCERARAGEADEEAEEQTAPVKLKGTGDTEILFEGKAKALFLEQPGKWSEAGVVGTLTVRKHKGSGAHWLQINSEQARSQLE